MTMGTHYEAAIKKRTRIVATLGPASENPDTLRDMMLAGLDVVRINFSHAQHEHVTDVVQMVRKVARQTGTQIAILGDLRGPRIRVGEVEGGTIPLNAGSRIMLTPRQVTGSSDMVSISFPELAKDLEVGSILLLDDGNLELRVADLTSKGDIRCDIIRGGFLSSRRGINVPGRKVSLPPLSKKDLADVDFCLLHDFDFLAQSFVQTSEDIRQLNQYIASKGGDIPVIAKIENLSSINDIENIVQEAYGVMVARGDMALEVSLQDVPIAQKRIISACRRAGRPVITATQMLESMTTSHKPTRAEVADVANAVLDGSDAIMLSGESAIGKHPALVIATMAQIASRTEESWWKEELPKPPPVVSSADISQTVSDATSWTAQRLGASTMITYTTSGRTARTISSHRPNIPILALTSSPRTLNRLCLSWGVKTRLIESLRGTAHMVHVAFREAVDSGLAKKGDIITITAGTPFGHAGSTNLLKVERIV